jgi:predicted transcriptional regulator of viral defense system
MKCPLIIKKLDIIDKKIVTSKEIKEYCSILKIDYLNTIKYLTRHKYLIVILKGIFYNPCFEERKTGNYVMTHHEAISEALKIKGVKYWYFGLETAIKLNNLTHEFFNVEFIINDKISRVNTMKIFGNKVKFIKLKKDLFRFGLKKVGGVRISNIEKTILDKVYLYRYKAVDDNTIKNFILPYIKHCSKEKLKEYAKYYNQKIEDFVDSL